MTRRRFVATLVGTAAASAARGVSRAPAPFGPLPSRRQLRWHEAELYGFLHFTVNTFTDKEWGYGDEVRRRSLPDGLRRRSIAETARDVGMRGLILTCKHHDGFCLWPTRPPTIRSGGVGGEGKRRRGPRDFRRVPQHRDSVRRLSVAVGPEHHEYATSRVCRVLPRTLRELLTQYGPIYGVWFDGANGGDGYYGGARESARSTVDVL